MRYNDFIKHKIGLGRTDATIQAIKNHLDCFWRFYRSKRKKLKTISKKNLEDYLFYLRQKGYKSSTIRSRISGLRDFLRYKNIKVLPMFKITVPKALPKFLSFEDIKKIRQGIKKERDLLIFDTLYATGIRTAELCFLNCGNINGCSLLITGKGNKERMVEMPKSLYLRLKKFGNSHDTNKPLFLSKGKRITRSAVSSLIKRYGKKAQLSFKISPHRLRHSFATHFLNNGGRIEAVSTLLGHSTIATTQIYARLSNQKIRQEYTKFMRCLHFV